MIQHTQSTEAAIIIATVLFALALKCLRWNSEHVFLCHRFFCRSVHILRRELFRGKSPWIYFSVVLYFTDVLYRFATFERHLFMKKRESVMHILITNSMYIECKITLKNNIGLCEIPFHVMSSSFFPQGYTNEPLP